MAGPTEPGSERDPAPTRTEPPPDGIWPYLGVGCLTVTIGIAGGGMLGVLAAKIVGGFRGCVPQPDTSAPCEWTTFATWGARIGFILLPTISIWRMRRGRMRRNNE